LGRFDPQGGLTKVRNARKFEITRLEERGAVKYEIAEKIQKNSSDRKVRANA